MLKAGLKLIPGMQRAVRLVRARVQFRGSRDYWEQRYAIGGNSGAGSYGQLARFKADVINAFVREHGVNGVVELGCGDGNQLSLADYPRYIGVDVSPTAIERCRERFAEDDTKAFFTLEAYRQATPGPSELALSLDVIYHLVEDDVYDAHMQDLFQNASRFVIIYASNVDRKSEPHVRDRVFTDWIQHHAPQWTLFRHIPNRYPFDPEHQAQTSRSEFFVYGHSSPAIGKA